METVTTLDDKVRAFKVLLDKKDELAEQTKHPDDVTDINVGNTATQNPERGAP